jgi:RNA polymerase sigma-70 factor (ECF subfamily)
MDGGVGSFEHFFRREYGEVVRTLVPIVGNQPDAEGIAQDAFVKAMERWGRIGDYDRPGGWVRRVAIRDAVRSASRRRRERATRASTVTSGEDVDGRIDLERALQSLSPRQRAAVVLHHLAGWPTNEIAEALGCAEATVRVHLHRGRQALVVALAMDSEEVRDGS